MVRGTVPLGGVAAASESEPTQSTQRTTQTRRRSAISNGNSQCSDAASTLGTESR